jgi:hypothetical protein
MHKHADMIVPAARRSRFVAEKLMVGIDPSAAARKPRFVTSSGVVVIDTNHPTFIVGHLSLYPAKILAACGRDAASVTPPPEWNDLFKAGAACIDDVTQTLYPKFTLLAEFFLKATDTCMEVVASLDDATLEVPHPEERFRQRFGTVGATTNFLMNNHLALHLGQLSTWRRCMGLPPCEM